jgi:hypothetical protein
MIFEKENHPLSYNVYSNGEFDEKTYLYKNIYIYIITYSATHAPLPNLGKIMQQKVKKKKG